MKTQVKMLKVTQKESGIANLGWNIPEPYSRPEKIFNVQTVRVDTESFSSNKQFKKVKVMVPYKPKKWPVVKPPTIPLLRLPLRPYMRPRRPNQSLRSYNAARSRFERILARYESICDAKRLKYQNSLRNYHARMIKFKAFQEKLRNGVQKTFTVKTLTQKDLPWNPYSRTTKVTLPLRGTYNHTQRVWVGWPQKQITESTNVVGYMENYFRGPPNLSHQIITDLVAKATSAADSRATRKLHDAIGEQSVHIGNIIAERQQTVQMLGGLFKALIKAVAQFSWRNLAGWTVELLSFHKNKVLANQLLQFFFGIKPLLSDIHAGVEALTKKQSDSLIEVKARATSTRETTVNDNYYTASSQSWVREDDTLTVVIRVKVSYTLQYEVSSGTASTLQQLGLVNPAEILWEKMPWSFVIDWALPIGNWLRSFTSETGLDYKRGSKVTTTSVQILINRKFTSAASYSWATIDSSGDFSGLDHTINKTRVILTSRPKYDFPSFKNPVSWTHILEALALIRQQLR